MLVGSDSQPERLFLNERQFRRAYSHNILLPVSSVRGQGGLLLQKVTFEMADSTGMKKIKCYQLVDTGYFCQFLSQPYSFSVNLCTYGISTVNLAAVNNHNKREKRKLTQSVELIRN